RIYMNVSRAPRRWAFYYPGPFLMPPTGNGRLVPLHGPAFGLLTAPPQAGQDLPHMTRVIPNAELVVNQGGHPPQRPQVGRVADPKRALQQQPHELPLLGLRQRR